MVNVGKQLFYAAGSAGPSEAPGTLVQRPWVGSRPAGWRAERPGWLESVGSRDGRS